MSQALIQVGGTDGSKVNVPLNVSLLVSNSNNGGESSWFWVMTVPDGSNATLLDPAASSTSFTPDVEGTYFLQLTVNGTLTDTAIAGVLSLKTHKRIPAYQEQVEANTDATVTYHDGWNSAMSPMLRYLQDRVTGPTTFVAVAGSNDVQAGTIVFPSGKQVIKASLPGEETLLKVDLAHASTESEVLADLYYVVGAINGGPIVTGTLVVLLASGLFPATIISGIGSGTQVIYVSDAGLPSATAGTHLRIVGYQFLKDVSTTYGIWQSIAFSGIDVDPWAPEDASYVLTTADPALANATALDNVTTLPLPITGNSTETSGIVDLLKLALNHNALGVANNGLGISAYLKNSAGTSTKILQIAPVILTATAGAEIGGLLIKALNPTTGLTSDVLITSAGVYFSTGTATRELMVTGAANADLRIGTAVGSVWIKVAGTDRWKFDTSGNLLAQGSQEIDVSTAPSAGSKLTNKTYVDTKAAKTTTISTTSPLTGGGDLSASRTLAMPAAAGAGAGSAGYMTAAQAVALAQAVILTIGTPPAGLGAAKDITNFAGILAMFASGNVSLTSGAGTAKINATTQAELNGATVMVVGTTQVVAQSPSGMVLLQGQGTDAAGGIQASASHGGSIILTTYGGAGAGKIRTSSAGVTELISAGAALLQAGTGILTLESTANHVYVQSYAAKDVLIQALGTGNSGVSSAGGNVIIESATKIVYVLSGSSETGHVYIGITGTLWDFDGTGNLLAPGTATYQVKNLAAGSAASDAATAGQTAMGTFVMSADATGNAAATTYLPPGGWGVAANATVGYWIAPSAGVLRGLAVFGHTAVSGGTGQNYTVLKNDVATTLVCTVAAAAQTASDYAHTATFARGDKISLMAVSAAGSTGLRGGVTATISWTAA